MLEEFSPRSYTRSSLQAMTWEQCDVRRRQLPPPDDTPMSLTRRNGWRDSERLKTSSCKRSDGLQASMLRGFGGLATRS